jgi:hypothetical protein
LVREENKKSLVARAKEEHNIMTSLSEGYEKENAFNELPIIKTLILMRLINMTMSHACSCFLVAPIKVMISFIYSYPNIM